MIQQITDQATSPNTALPVIGAVTVFDLFNVSLPMFINLVTAVYVVLLAGHKGWQWYREWKQSREPKE